MPSTLTELIADWPHDQHVLGPLHGTCRRACKRCALERWRDEWATVYKCDYDVETALEGQNFDDVAKAASSAAVRKMLGVEDKP